ncbi:MAG: hypothetical protein ACYSW3_00495 [Planctomycetota bacterium]
MDFRNEQEFLDFINGVKPYSCTMKCKLFNYHGKKVSDGHPANPPYKYWCLCGRRPWKDEMKV